MYRSSVVWWLECVTAIGLVVAFLGGVTIFGVAHQTIQGKAGGRALRDALDPLPLPIVLFYGLFGAERILALAPH